MSEPVYVSIYTRAQAIADGVLVDVSPTAREAGFRFPVAVTEAVWRGVVEATAANRDTAGQLWDLLQIMRLAGRRSTGSRVDFQVSTNGKTHDLYALCGPGDTPEPVITVMLPEED